MAIFHCEIEFNIILHGLCKTRVALVHKHHLSHVEVFSTLYLVITDGNAIELLHLMLGCNVTPRNPLLLEVDNDTATRDEVLSCDLEVRVVRYREQFASFLVQVLPIHLEFLLGVVNT